MGVPEGLSTRARTWGPPVGASARTSTVNSVLTSRSTPEEYRGVKEAQSSPGGPLQHPLRAHGPLSTHRGFKGELAYPWGPTPHSLHSQNFSPGMREKPQGTLSSGGGKRDKGRRDACGVPRRAPFRGHVRGEEMLVTMGVSMAMVLSMQGGGAH